MKSNDTIIGLSVCPLCAVRKKPNKTTWYSSATMPPPTQELSAFELPIRCSSVFSAGTDWLSIAFKSHCFNSPDSLTLTTYLSDTTLKIYKIVGNYFHKITNKFTYRRSTIFSLSKSIFLTGIPDLTSQTLKKQLIWYSEINCRFKKLASIFGYFLGAIRRRAARSNSDRRTRRSGSRGNGAEGRIRLSGFRKLLHIGRDRLLCL